MNSSLNMKETHFSGFLEFVTAVSWAEAQNKEGEFICGVPDPTAAGLAPRLHL